jgi:hypothetical protein
MSTFRRVALLRFALAAAVPLLFLFTAVMPSPATAGTNGTIPRGSIQATKDCSPDLVRPGQPVLCKIVITNTGSAPVKVQWIDILAGGGRYPHDTQTSLLIPSSHSLNRQTYGPYVIELLPLVPFVTEVVVTPWSSKADCKSSFYASLTNEVHVDPVGGGPHLATATTSFSVSCSAGHSR